MQKHLLIGNGVNIQFGGSDYINKNIITRAFNYLENDNFPSEIYPIEIGEYIKEYLYGSFTKIMKGKYDRFVATSSEEIELENFKSRYKFSRSKVRYYDIAFEDYFLIHQLFCRKKNIINPNKYDFQECIRMLFLDSIYNNGKINEIHSNFSDKFTDWLEDFDSIFTTNYDKNIEIATEKDINYLHGAFHIKKDIYDHNSFRNLISDKPIESSVIVEGYDHLYSTALTTSSGSLKKFAGNMHPNANSAIEKFAEGSKNDKDIKKEIENWKTSEQKLVRNLYEAVMLKIENPELEFKDYYPFDKLEDIKGTLTILGLSPNNDNHIIDMISENKNIDKVIYYYFDIKEGRYLERNLNNKKSELNNVKEFWANCSSKT